MSRPLVSCIMPTGRRRGFARQALAAFSRRTYRDAELVVVDDGEESVEDICADQADVRYVRLSQRTRTGTKLNIGIEHAHGEVIQKTDDDDWYGPGFIETAVGRLTDPAVDRDRVIAAWCCFLVLVAGDRVVRFSGHGWKTGGTLCFTKHLWREQPFRDVWGGVDGDFLRDHPVPLVRVCAPEQYMVVRHGSNTWTMMQGGETADDYLRKRNVYCDDVARVTGPESAGFHQALSRGDVSVIS